MPSSETFEFTVKGQTANGDVFQQTFTATGASIERATVTVPAAKTGSLTTRTDNDTSTLTMASGHGFATNDKVDVFWTGGSRRNMTATVTGNSVVVDGGSGDNLPALNTAVTAMKPTSLDFVVDGDTVVGLGVSCQVPGWIVFVDDSAADITAATFKITEPSGAGRAWASGNGVTNPLASKTTTKVKMSHGSTTGRVMQAAAVFGAPP